MKYFIIAGEQSADLHGSNLMRAILAKDRTATFCYWGGSAMEAVAPGKLLDISETAIMGFAEVIKNLGKIKAFFKITKEAITQFEPDTIILIDYPGFNLRLARWAKRHGYKIAYYISPQLWAWKKGRKESIRKYVDELIVILPFEQAWYKKEGITAHYVGHPLVEAFAKYNYQSLPKQDKPVLALLPGSRQQEVSKMLPIMMEAARKVQNRYQVVVAATNYVLTDIYTAHVANTDALVVTDRTYDVLAASSLAIVTSGTATLETALHGVPQVVCYKTASINYSIGKRLVDLQYISLVNIILDEAAIPELIQHDFTMKKLVAAINDLENEADIVKAKYQRLHTLLSSERSASENAAEIIYNLAKK